MDKEKAIRFAGLMESYLNIPSFVCEMIEKDLCNYKYKETIEYVINRRNEIENKKEYISEQQLINQYIDLQQRIDKAVEVIDLITPELWNISNKMTYRLKDIKYILKGDDINE